MGATEKVMLDKLKKNKISRELTAGVSLPNKLIPLVDGPEIYTAMGKAIKGAKKYIYITAWLLHVNVKLDGVPLKKLLLDKANEGVNVKILWCDLDPVMQKLNKNQTEWEEQEATRRLRSNDKTGNVQVIVSKMNDLKAKHKNLQIILRPFAKYPLLLGSHHQKSVVVDGNKAFVSGCDIVFHSQNSTNWHDTSVYIQGEGVYGVEKNFVDRWNYEVGEISEEKIKKFGYGEIEIGENAKESDKCKAILTMPSWCWRNTDIWSAYEDLIDDAEEEILIVNQYVRHPDIAKNLIKALKRGVKVKIVLPHMSEELREANSDDPSIIMHKISAYAEYRFFKSLKTLDADVLSEPHSYVIKQKEKDVKLEIYSPKKIGRPYVHSKVLIADKKKCTVGSANLNGRSMNAYADSEINVLIDDQRFCEALHEKLTGVSKKWPLVSHDIEISEKKSRITKKEINMKIEMFRKLSQEGEGVAAQVAAYIIKHNINSATGGIITDELEEADTAEALRDALYLHHDIHSFI